MYRRYVSYRIIDTIHKPNENIDPNIFFKINTGKRTRGHYVTLVKGQSRLDVRSILFPRGPSMSGINCQLIVCILVVLICLE